MNDIIHLYLDDSGTRHLDRKTGKLPKHGYDYFALGGIAIKQSDEENIRKLYDKFCEKWKINYPLHSVEIRGPHGNFAWIGKLSTEEKNYFIDDLYQLLLDIPAFGIACVIDRPGYDHRYRSRYENKRWHLCKTAFNILVERAAKYAYKEGCKLRILPEKCNKTEDNRLQEYYEYLKSNGLPFDSSTSAQYQPLSASDFKQLLYEFKLKEKSSPMVQLADLYLWPMAIGGYDKGNKTYNRFVEDKKLIDCLYSSEENSYLGIKYSCFDLVHENISSK